MLNLKRFDEGAWFEYQPGVEFKIKPLSKYDFVNIRNRCKRKIVVSGLPAPDNIVDDIDSAMVTVESVKTCLLETKGITIEGVDYPARDLLIQAIFEKEELVIFILNHASEVFASAEKGLEEELKNSQRSQNGS